MRDVFYCVFVLLWCACYHRSPARLSGCIDYWSTLHCTHIWHICILHLQLFYIFYLFSRV